MDQVSRPLLVALAATVALMAIWVVALRPKPVAVENTPLAPTQAIGQAKQAAAISAAANAKAQAAAGNAGQAAQPGVAAAQPAAAVAAKPATPHAGAGQKAPVTHAQRSLGERRDAAVMRDVARGKVVVVLFWNPEAADDLATRGALRDLDLHGGKVVVRVVPITDVAQYSSITRGVSIAQSPTTVVIGHKGRTRAIAGLSEPRELSQAVGDALAGH